MTAPYRSKPPVNDNDYEVNQDPTRLNRVYNNILGGNGDRTITEEVKWLAVTHKRRRIVELQASLSLLHGRSATSVKLPDDGYDREPFQHPALERLESITLQRQFELLEKDRMAGLGKRYGLDGVVRWKPKNVSFYATLYIYALGTNRTPTGQGFMESIWVSTHHSAGVICSYRGSSITAGWTSRE
ncbi:uncharacterized protein KY384_005214 [Bacidia gigantensis]|uniref:uncharacterized protein n=1 Tax=Bacidia gigantensis TaxID=2732470 RepID=UPI001D044680|nr:uncharacterized protein KY384_005214 [Bacidia gigantensis]KAG8529733.1 hypothetical protein KY384_005214 [Bacidia gigantensis]